MARKLIEKGARFTPRCYAPLESSGNGCLRQPIQTFFYCDSHESQQRGKTPRVKFWWKFSKIIFDQFSGHFRQFRATLVFSSNREFFFLTQHQSWAGSCSIWGSPRGESQDQCKLSTNEKPRSIVPKSSRPISYLTKPGGGTEILVFRRSRSFVTLKSVFDGLLTYKNISFTKNVGKHKPVGLFSNKQKGSNKTPFLAYVDLLSPPNALNTYMGQRLQDGKYPK